MFFFKRWSRKSYALFHTLKKEVRISRLSIDLLQSQPVAVKQLSFARTESNSSHEYDWEHAPPPDLLELFGIDLLIDFKVVQVACASDSIIMSPRNLLLFFKSILYAFHSLLLSPLNLKINFLKHSKHPYTKGSLYRFVLGETGDTDRLNHYLA